MQAHSGNWIGAILSAFPAETWGLAQLLLDMSLWTQRGWEEVPLLQNSALLLDGRLSRHEDQMEGP